MNFIQGIKGGKQAHMILFLSIWLFSITGCNSGTAVSDIDSSKIDSLISIRKINDRTLLVNFGYDAISAIKTERGILIIDAGISTGLTSRYKNIIREKFHSDDFQYLIYTHGHHDHCRGSSVFPNSRIVGQANCIEEITTQSADPQRVIRDLAGTVKDYDLQLQKSVSGSDEWKELFTQKMRYQNAYFDVKNSVLIKKPDLTFSDSLTLDLGDTTPEMIFFGKCHSASDILIYIPEIKTIFVGDLFSEYGRPSINDKLVADKEKWKRAIRWIEIRMAGIENVIDGHGRILSAGDLEEFNSNIMRRCSTD
jgi:glyoxylase-like metal-dependent hydrolase (beta-lactamase superfamily II)